MRMRHTCAGLVLASSLLPAPVQVESLDNGFRVPPMGWSSWYGFTQNINETMLREMADGMVSSGLHRAGYEHIWIDDGWAIGRDNSSNPPGHVVVDPVLFPSGMRNLSDYLHDRGLKFGIYTSKGPLTCLGYQPTQPNRPGSCGYEQVDADVYAHEWQVDQVKDDGCGQCPQHEPFAAMRDALNNTGRPIFYAIHSSIIGTGNPNATVANMWRTGGDLSSATYDMWTNRLDLATSDAQAALTGPGAFPNPDFLEVGYSPRWHKGQANGMSDLEQRSMFTMWAALPGPLILSADLRPGAPSGGIDDKATMDTLTNTEVIAVNQDDLAQPMRPVLREDGLEIWRKPLTEHRTAVVLFHRNYSSAPQPPSPGPTPHTGVRVTLGPCDEKSLAFDNVNSSLVVRGSSGLCVGKVGVCECANPPSPTLGLVQCDRSDTSQHWSANPGGEFMNDAQHDMNAGPECAGSPGQNLLIYPFQGHANEKWTLDAASGILRSGSATSSRCVSLAASPGPGPQQPRNITVTWEQLGLNSTQAMLVRDLWAQTTLGNFSGSFSAELAWHEARLYLLTNAV